MAVTEQLNIRVSKELIADLDTIAEILKINRSEWLKTKIAEDVHEEKNKLFMEVGTLFAQDKITKQEVERRVSKQIADEMEEVRDLADESARRGLEHGKRLKGKLRH